MQNLMIPLKQQKHRNTEETWQTVSINTPFCTRSAAFTDEEFSRHFDPQLYDAAVLRSLGLVAGDQEEGDLAGNSPDVKSPKHKATIKPKRSKEKVMVTKMLTKICIHEIIEGRKLEDDMLWNVIPTLETKLDKDTNDVISGEREDDYRIQGVDADADNNGQVSATIQMLLADAEGDIEQPVEHDGEGDAAGLEITDMTAELTDTSVQITTADNANRIKFCGKCYGVTEQGPVHWNDVN